MNYDQWKQAEPYDWHDEEYYEYLNSHHDCCICGDRDVPEANLYRTSMGWMHIDCYNEIVNYAAEDGSEIPELL